MQMNSNQMELRIQKIKDELQKIGAMRPGSLNEQYSVCGVKGCACADLEKPKKHGPYYQLSYVHQGKSSSQFIQREFLTKTEKQLVEFKKFKSLTNEWIDLALTVAKETLQEEREILKLSKKKLKNKGTKSQEK
jgi:hypothetical protein